MIGQILIWSGAIIDIPAGWSLCDGTSGTPDLRDKFVMGAGLGEDPGNVGGDTSHVHTLTSEVNTPVSAGAQFVIAGDTPSAEHLPPFHALAYIMHTS